MADIRERIIIDSVDNTTRGMRTAQNNLNAFDRTLRRVQTTLMGFVGINIAVHLVKGIQQASDAAVELEAKLRLMTDSTDDFNYAQQELVKLSLESGSSLEANTILFTRMNKAIKSMGGNTQTTLDTTAALSQGLRISGASTQESASVIRQWSQAMASGVLRGEEFNAVSENGARIIQALSTSLGVSIGELRAMSKEGVLTADVVTEALLRQSKVLAEENAQLPLTIGRAIENINTKYLLFLQSMKDGNSTIAESINSLAENFDGIVSALGALLNVAIAYAAIGVAKHFVTQVKAARALIVASREQALATLQESQAQEMLIVNARTAKAIETRLALTRANASVNNIKNSIAEAQATVRRIALIEQEMAIETAKLQRQIAWEKRINNSQQVAIAHQHKLIALQNRHRLSTGALREAKMVLAGTEASLTTAITAQTAALNANTFAQGRNAAAAIASSASQIGIFSKLWKIVKGLGSALLGIPGIIAYIAFEITTRFVPLEILLARFRMHWEQLVQTVTYVWDVIRNKGTTKEAFEEHIEALRKVQDKYYETIDKVIEAEQKQRAEFNKTNDLRKKGTIESLNKISQAEEKHQKKIDENIGREGELRKLELNRRLMSKHEFQAESDAIDAEIFQQQTQSRLDRYKKEIDEYNVFYDSKIEALLIANEKIASETELTEEHIKSIRLGYWAHEADLQKQHNSKIAGLQKENNDEIVRLSSDKARRLKEISQKSLDALIDSANQLMDEQSEALDRSKSVMQEYDDFMKEMLGDQRADYVKLSDAQNIQRDIEKKLREASKAEAEGNHKIAQKLNEEALEDSKKLTKEYKNIADTADKGSRSQVVAQGSVKNALDLVKKASEGVRDSSNQMAEALDGQVEKRKKDIETYQQLITELDKQLNSDRTITPDVDTEKAYRELDAIDRKIKALSQEVIVKVKTVKTGGGGGVDSPATRAAGGFIPRANKVPGTGTGDKVKALLEPGEFIMRKSAVQKFGESAMYAMNSGKDILKRATGGIVPKHFRIGGSVEASLPSKDGTITDEYLERLTRFYLDKYHEQNKQIKFRPAGQKGALQAYNSRYAMTVYQGILKSIASLKGKSMISASRVIEANRDISDWLLRHKNGMKRSEGNDLKELLLIRDTFSQFKLGGMVRKFAEGGSVPGSGLGDTVKAMLTPGEFVMNKGSVQQFGTDFMRSINSGLLPQRFAAGGLVGADNASGGEMINVTLNLNGKQATGSFPQNDATMNLIEQLKTAGASS